MMDFEMQLSFSLLQEMSTSLYIMTMEVLGEGESSICKVFACQLCYFALIFSFVCKSLVVDLGVFLFCCVGFDFGGQWFWWLWLIEEVKDN
ncbi:unnamed protein product [Camellia sinensis]